MRENEHIRKAAKEAKVFLWQLADRLGVCELTMTRWLRKPLSKEKEAQIMAAIDDLREG